MLGRQEELPHHHTGKASLNFVSVVAVTIQQAVQSKPILSAIGNCERHKYMEEYCLGTAETVYRWIGG